MMKNPTEAASGIKNKNVDELELGDICSFFVTSRLFTAKVAYSRALG
jgi:hypothetical protein